MTGTAATLVRRRSPRQRVMAWRIRRHIVTQLLDEPYDGDDPLRDEAVDSLGIEQLVEWLEDRFGVHFDDEEVVVENFSSLRALAALVDRKRLDRRDGRDA